MSLIIYAAGTGDRNQRGMQGAVSLGRHIANRLGEIPEVVGSRTTVVDGGWSVQLETALPSLLLLASAFGPDIAAGRRPITFMSRCAASMATLPVVARHAPDAAIVWFDAHGDCNVPAAGSDTGYLGGMVLTGAAGEWHTGLGGDLDLANVVLVGARDLDPPELERIERGQIRHVPVGPNLAKRLAEAVAGRKVYIHLDCDVLDAGLIATEYQSPGGLSCAELAEAFALLADHDVLGLEVTEYENAWPNGEPSDPEPLRQAIEPVLLRLKGA